MTTPVLYTTPPLPAENSGDPADHLQDLSIVDVHVFFDNLIRGYTRLEQSALTLAADLPALPPEIIRLRCQGLRNDQLLLATLDCQVNDILNLAWEELATSRYISHYRNVFSATMQAIEVVQQQLHAMRNSLAAKMPCPESRNDTDPA